MHRNAGSHFQFGKYYLKTLFWIFWGCLFAAISIDVILIPNELIDGGIVGIAMMISYLTSYDYLPYYLILLNIPFGFLALKMGTLEEAEVLVARRFSCKEQPSR